MGGVAEKSTGRVTNGRQPGCQLTVAVLHGERVNENDRKRGGMEEEGKDREKGRVTARTPKSC